MHACRSIRTVTSCLPSSGLYFVDSLGHRYVTLTYEPLWVFFWGGVVQSVKHTSLTPLTHELLHSFTLSLFHSFTHARTHVRTRRCCFSLCDALHPSLGGLCDAWVEAVNRARPYSVTVGSTLPASLHHVAGDHPVFLLALHRAKLAMQARASRSPTRSK